MINSLDAINIIQRLKSPYDVIIRMAAETGYRISDVLAMKPSDYNRYTQSITIKESKTGKTRTVQISNWLAEQLDKRYCETAHYLFYNHSLGRQFTRQTVHRHLQRAAMREGIRCSAHSFRKLYAMRLYQQTHDIGAVQEALNHKYPSTTLGYLDIDINELLRASKR